MRKVDRVDLLAGLLVLATGVYFAVGALEYRMGTITRMGPGFVPFWLGVIAALLGAVIAATALGRAGRLPEFAWRASGSVLGAILAFGVLLPLFGLLTAAFAASAISMTGNPAAGKRLILLTSAAITLICWTVFIATLGLPIPVWEMPF
ncbi:tripartite tricarboxylate transporter TctB family protein [Roseitranquillus sediminis]|uniref:tripartite tricarboxylate transporter TctB family protein n=1 Tax=Roseitranquillus sediminis TaxID=2809051 RepID=UPI001D0CB198|nr:tripartite tricarboxylate transporter TctB family protein [Roseitranquillus sediminis]MBM9592995.1 tripartite tricarboxylate transporter TctB family protein [Roseitranquillus sediminis]